MNLNEWSLLFTLLGSIIVLTALVSIMIRHRFKGRSITIAAAHILGIFAGIGGASHGPGEILQGNVAPAGTLIEAWPMLTLLMGEPVMTVIPSFLVSGVLAIISGIVVTIWTATQIHRKNGGLILIMLSIVMLFVGGGLLPPVLGIIAGIIGRQNKQTYDKHNSVRGAQNQFSRGGDMH